MSTPQINWRLTLPILGSLIVHGCLFLSVAILTKTDSQKTSVYHVSLRAHVHTPAAKHSKRTELVLPSKPRAIVMPAQAGIRRQADIQSQHTVVAPTPVVMPAEAGIQEDLSEPAEPADIVKTVFTGRAKEHGIEGEVVFNLTVGPDGHVQDAEIIKRLGYGLDENALSAILKSTFVAAKDSLGNATISRVIYKYKFRIENL